MSQQADHLSHLVGAFKLSAEQMDAEVAANDEGPVTIDITPAQQRIGMR